MEQIAFYCTFDGHQKQAISRFCLNRTCYEFTRQKVCDLCLYQNHLDHQSDCFEVDHIIVIIQNENDRLTHFIEEIVFSPQLLQRFQTFDIEMKNAQMYLRMFDSNDNIKFAINVAVRCYNQLIQEELKYYIYVENLQNEQQRLNLLKKLDDSYQLVIEGYLLKNLLRKGTFRLYLKAEIYESLNQYNNWREALQFYNQAQKMTFNPDLILQIQKKKYNMLLDCQQFEEAEEVLNQMIGMHMDPTENIVYQYIRKAISMVKNKPYLNIYGDILRRLYRHIDNYFLVSGINLQHLAVMQFVFREFEKSLENIKEIKVDDAAFPIAQIFQMICLIRLRRVEKAIQVINQALAQNPQNKEFCYWKKCILFLSSFEDQAILDFDEPTLLCAQLSAQSITLARCENIKGALETIDQALKIIPNQNLVLYIKGMLLIHSGEDVKATKIFNQIEINQFDDFQKVIKASILRYQNKTWDSKITLMKVEKFLQNHLCYDIYQKLIRIEKWANLYCQGKFEQAFNNLEILKPFDPNNSQLATLKAVTLAQLNKLDLAEKEIDYAIEILKTKPFKKDTFYLLYVKGCILAQKQDYKKAKKCFKETMKQSPNFHKAYACIGNFYQKKALMLIRLKKYKKAIIFFKTVKQLSASYNLGVALFYENQYNKAKEQFEKLNTYKNSDLYLGVSLYLQLAITLMQMAQYKEAQTVFLNLQQVDERLQNREIFQGLILIGLEEYENALEVINNQINVFGENWQLQLFKSLALYCLAQYEESLAAIEVVQQIQREKSQIVVNFLNALILFKLNNQIEAQLFLEIIKNQIQVNPCKSDYEDIIKTNSIQRNNFQLISYNKGNNIRAPLQGLNNQIVKKMKEVRIIFILAFLLRQIVQQIEPMEADDESINIKRSKIDSWLFTVDFEIFFKDLQQLFNYDQKKTPS